MSQMHIINPRRCTVYVIYTHYGQGVTFRTGPPELRRRAGLWAHFYVRQHPASCSCLRCLRRVSAGPAVLPLGRKVSRLYKV